MHTEKQHEWNNHDIPIKCPCQFCKDRSAGCHCKCQAYKDFSEELRRRRVARSEFYKKADIQTAGSKRFYRSKIGKANYFNVKGGTL